jgi:hypothetical protein
MGTCDSKEKCRQNRGNELSRLSTGVLHGKSRFVFCRFAKNVRADFAVFLRACFPRNVESIFVVLYYESSALRSSSRLPENLWPPENRL